MQKSVVKAALWTVFGGYCLVLVYILFVSRISSVHYSYSEYFSRFTNFIPFKTVIEYVQRYGEGYRRLSLINLLGNLVLFLPMGAFLPCLFKRLGRIWHVLLVLIAAVIAVELAQGLLRVGSIDVDDLIFNVLGGAAGYAIIRIPPIGAWFERKGIILSEKDEKQ